MSPNPERMNRLAESIRPYQKEGMSGSSLPLLPDIILSPFNVT